MFLLYESEFVYNIILAPALARGLSRHQPRLGERSFILPPASFYSATPLINAGGKGMLPLVGDLHHGEADDLVTQLEALLEHLCDGVL